VAFLEHFTDREEERNGTLGHFCAKPATNGHKYQSQKPAEHRPNNNETNTSAKREFLPNRCPLARNVDVKGSRDRSNNHSAFHPRLCVDNHSLMQA